MFAPPDMSVASFLEMAIETPPADAIKKTLEFLEVYFIDSKYFDIISFLIYLYYFKIILSNLELFIKNLIRMLQRLELF